MKFVLVFWGLFLLEAQRRAQVGATDSGPNICEAKENYAEVRCPEDEICTRDDGDHGHCHLPGTDLTVHCSNTDVELYAIQVHDDCDNFENRCPGVKVCCNLPQGHRCVDPTDWQQMKNVRR